LGHDEIVQMASKKTLTLLHMSGQMQGTKASARQPKDAVRVDETVRVPKYFINGTEFMSIDVRAGYKSVLGWRKALN
jgi:hypothetical protein